MKEVIIKNNNWIWEDILRDIFEIDNEEEIEKIQKVIIMVDEYDSYIPE